MIAGICAGLIDRPAIASIYAAFPAPLMIADICAGLSGLPAIPNICAVFRVR